MDQSTLTYPSTTPRPAGSCFVAAQQDASAAPSRGWSRRGFLGVVAALAVGTATGCSAAAADTQSVVEAAPTEFSPLGRTPRRGSGLSSGSTVGPTKPYQLTASSELSEDYFLVQNHLIDPAKDTVVAYSRTDGLAEAIVLQDGTAKQIYRDATQPGGWNVNPIPGADGVTHLVAGVSTPLNASGKPLPGAPRLRVFYVKSGSDQLWVASQGLGPGTTTRDFTIDHLPWSTDASNLQISVNANASLLVSAMKPSTGVRSGDAQLWFCHDTTGSLQQGLMTGFSYDPTVYGDWAAVGTRFYLDGLTPQLYLYLAGGVNEAMTEEDPAVHLWKGTLSTGTTAATLQDSRLGAVSPPDGLDVVDIAYLSSMRSTGMPTALIWTVHDYQGEKAGRPQLWAVTWADAWIWTELLLPDAVTRNVGSAFPISTALTPRSTPATHSADNQQLLDVFVVADGTLHILRQVEQPKSSDDTQRPVYTPLIPLQPGVAAMTSQAAVSTGNELLVVGTDRVLQTLEKDPISGRWADAELQLPASSLQQDSAYRVTLALTDVAWNLPVANQPMTITASTAAIASIEAPDGVRTVVLGAEPVTVTTDSQGEVMLALLADGLGTATLTITAAGVSQPLTVYPSAAVNTYMTGDSQQQLNYLAPLSTTTLQNAKTPTGEVVAPKATNPQDPSDDGAAQDAVSTMSQAATFATQGAKLGRRASTVGRIDGGRTHGSDPRRHAGKNRHGGKSRHVAKTVTTVEVTGLVNSLDHWGHDALHAIKKSAVAVDHIAVDAEQKIVTIATDLSQWVDNTVAIVVHDIEDAAHVLHAAFNKLGADIVHAVKWLEAEVLGVLESAKTLSDKFDTWIGNLTGFTATTFGTEQSAVVGWLKDEQQWVTTKLTDLARRYSDHTTLSTMAQQPPRPDGPGGQRRTQPKPTRPVDAAGDGQPPVHGDWFYRKIKHELAGSGLTLDLSSLPDLKTKVINFGQQSITHSSRFQDRFIDDFWKGFISGVVKHPDDVTDVLIQPLLQALLKVVDDAFDFAENIVAEAFDLLHDIALAIPALLAGTTLKNLPILGGLMRLVGLGNVPIGRVANLVFAFPAALTYKIARGAQAQPFASTAAARRRPRAVGDVASDLQICAASVMGTWAVFDTVSAAFVAGGDDGGLLFGAIDIAAPLIVTILTTPAAHDGAPFFAPPVSGDMADVLGFVAWIFGAVPAFCAALPLVIEKVIPGQENAKDAKEFVQMGIWFQALTGVLALVFGMVANSQKDDPKGADYAGATLNNMPTISAAGLSDALIESTAGVSVVVTMALTLICGGVGATIYGLDG